MKKRNDKSERALTRRGFAVAGLAGMGMIMARAAGTRRVAANVSMKEAAHYVALDNGERKNET
ncbi:MAG TPA: hypothetical protein VM658_07775 [bacterium]|nr:hypothetical protein [bacterium]